MTATTDHPCFRQPNSEDIVLWKYMDFIKFVSLISSKSLFFCRADLLGDPFEGSYSKANEKLRPYVYKDLEQDLFIKMTNQMANFAKWIREWTYINCWHANEYESAAMWDLYGKTNHAVAIVTDYKTLKAVLSEKVYLGLVNYIDYEKEWLPEGNTFYPFMHKRKSFEHEREVRAIIQELPNEDNKIAVGKKNQINGIKIEVDVKVLIKKIYVSPVTQDWIVELTKEVARKFGIIAPVQKSNLYSSPVF